MRIKTQDLTGHALDWAVAQCVGTCNYVKPNQKRGTTKWEVLPCTLRYSTNWIHGGPIIEQEGISWHCGNKSSWHAYGYGSADNFTGPTPLIAAMRCYVASKLGECVEVPEEIL